MLTGVASSSRRRLSGEQDSRIGRNKSYEALSPRLTIPTRVKVELVKLSLHSNAHHRRGQLQLVGQVWTREREPRCGLQLTSATIVDKRRYASTTWMRINFWRHSWRCIQDRGYDTARCRQVGDIDGRGKAMALVATNGRNQSWQNRNGLWLLIGSGRNRKYYQITFSHSLRSCEFLLLCQNQSICKIQKVLSRKDKLDCYGKNMPACMQAWTSTIGCLSFLSYCGFCHFLPFSWFTETSAK